MQAWQWRMGEAKAEEPTNQMVDDSWPSKTGRNMTRGESKCASDPEMHCGSETDSKSRSKRRKIPGSRPCIVNTSGDTPANHRPLATCAACREPKSRRRHQRMRTRLYHSSLNQVHASIGPRARDRLEYRCCKLGHSGVRCGAGRNPRRWSAAGSRARPRGIARVP